MSDSVHEVAKDRFLEVKTIPQDYCYSCGIVENNPILIQVSYTNGATGMSFCSDCITKVKNSINKQIREQKKNG